LEFTVPMAVTISIFLTFMRMSQENEIVAIKGAGVSIYKLLPPVIAFCFMGVLLTMCVSVFGVPWGTLSIKKKSIEIARSSIDAALHERQFNSELEGVMIYVSHIDIKTKTLKNVFIEDRRTKGIVNISTAPDGKLIQSGADHIYTIKLYNGMINQVDLEDKSVNNIHFGSYDTNLDLDDMNGGSTKIAKELDERDIVDLIRFIRSGTLNKLDLSAALMEFHERFAIPFACMSLGLLSFPLGIQSASLRRSSGFSLGVFFLLFYYFLQAAGCSAGESGIFSPFLSMWLPNVIVGWVGVLFLIRNAKGKPVQFPAFISATLDLPFKYIKFWII